GAGGGGTVWIRGFLRLSMKCGASVLSRKVGFPSREALGGIASLAGGAEVAASSGLAPFTEPRSSIAVLRLRSSSLIVSSLLLAWTCWQAFRRETSRLPRFSIYSAGRLPAWRCKYQCD